MAYSPTNWLEGQTKLGPTNLNKLENGLQAAAVVGDAALPMSAGSGSPLTGILYAGSASGVNVSSPTWSLGRAFGYVGAAYDGVFYIDGFSEAAGTNSPVTYANLYGGTATKTGAGNLHGFWSSISHQGTGEAGLFIGDLTSTAGGNIFGVHALLVGSVAANMFGAKIELSPSVIQTGKGAVGVWSLNSNDTYQLTEGIRVSGNWQRAFAIYSDAASSNKYFTIEQNGVVHLGLAEAVNLYSSGTNALKTDGQMFAAKGFTTLAKAGIPADGDVVSGSAGTIVLDDTNKRLYVRTSLGWQYAALT